MTRAAGAWLHIAPLLKRLDCFDDGVEVGPIAGFQLGMDELSLGANFKGAAAGRNESEGRNAFSEFEDLGRQTDGLGRVVSNHAVLD